MCKVRNREAEHLTDSEYLGTLDGNIMRKLLKSSVGEERANGRRCGFKDAPTSITSKAPPRTGITHRVEHTHTYIWE
jgi:hypothetical protein